MSDDLRKRFDEAVKFINNSKPGSVKLSNSQKLTFYALFKTATVGAPNGKRPSILNLLHRYKYDAWKKVADAGTTKEEAMQRFIDEFSKIKPDAKL